MLVSPYDCVSKKQCQKYRHRKHSLNSLRTVPVISLHQHYLLRHIVTLLRFAESKDTAETRVRLLVSVRYTHPTASSDVEPCQVTLIVDDRNKTDVIREHIDVIARWYGHRNLKLLGNVRSDRNYSMDLLRTFLGR